MSGKKKNKKMHPRKSGAHFFIPKLKSVKVIFITNA